MKTFSHDGLNFMLQIEQDYDAGLPWENDDGHGIVTTDPSTPGALHLGAGWYYDQHASLAKAEQDEWGLPPELAAGLAPHEVTYKAMLLDFQRLKDWAEEAWWYVGVIVTLLDLDGGKTREHESLWCIESDSEAYLEQVGIELADMISQRVGKSKQVTHGAVSQQIRAKAERPWNRDVYRHIRRVLIERGDPKANATAMRFAKRKGAPGKLIAAFEREYPND